MKKIIFLCTIFFTLFNILTISSNHIIEMKNDSQELLNTLVEYKIDIDFSKSETHTLNARYLNTEFDFNFLGFTSEEWDVIEREYTRIIALQNNPNEEIKQMILEEIFVKAIEEKRKSNLVISLSLTQMPMYSSYNINLSELWVCIMHPVSCFSAKDDADLAVSKTVELYGRNGADDDSDAFRHAYWNALMTYHQGSETAEMFATAHEATSSGLPKEMDLFNNAQGRLRTPTWQNYYEPHVIGVKTDDLAIFISDSVRVGIMRKIVNNSLVPTDVGETYQPNFSPC